MDALQSVVDDTVQLCMEIEAARLLFKKEATAVVRAAEKEEKEEEEPAEQGWNATMDPTRARKEE